MSTFKEFLIEMAGQFRYIGSRPVSGMGSQVQSQNERGGIDYRNPKVTINPGDIGVIETGQSRMEYTRSGKTPTATQYFVLSDRSARVSLDDLGGMDNLQYIDDQHAR